MSNPEPTLQSKRSTTFIYALLDPLTLEIRYVGKSNDPHERLRGHLIDSKCDRENNRKANWIRSLLRRGLKPKMEIIDEVSVLEWEPAEAAYIIFYKKEGCDLLNGTPGGDGVEGGKPLSSEHRAKLVVSQRRRREAEVPIYTVNGVTGSLTSLCEHFKKSQQERHRIWGRINTLGWSAEQAFAYPKRINQYRGGGGPKGRAYTVGGITAGLTELCEVFGINKNTAISRLRKGWPPERAFKAKPMHPRRRLVAASPNQLTLF